MPLHIGEVGEIEVSTEPNLALVAAYISSGNAVLLVGPSFCGNSTNLDGEKIPQFEEFTDRCCKKFKLNKDDFSSAQELTDYLTRKEDAKNSLKSYLRSQYGVKKLDNRVYLLSSFVWRRIYTFDISDGIEVAYARTPTRQQDITVVLPDEPVSRLKVSGPRLELVKLNGDGLAESAECIFTDPSFENSAQYSRWVDTLKLDLEINPVIVLASLEDRDFIFNRLRSLHRGLSYQDLVFVCPDLKEHQQELLEQQSAVYVNFDGVKFLEALTDVFPEGKTLDDISERNTGFVIKNKILQSVINESFTSITNRNLEALSKDDVQSGIHALYRGAHVHWGDVVHGIHADLVPFRNWRNRISRALEQRFPARHIFLLLSPAGMGKSVGLMAVTYWLRQRTDLPILWLEADGDLRAFFIRKREGDFPNGVFLVIDNITNYIDAFDDVDPEKFDNVCVICTSRETRWNKYKRRIPELFEAVSEPIRQLNRTDAEEVHNKIARYGTTVYFESDKKEEQIREIITRSQKDMLVLIRELGQGRKFDEIVKSEVADLDERQKFSYLLVCLPDRNQIPLPMDLFGHAFRERYADGELRSCLDSMGRLVELSPNSRTIRTRHSVIAQYVVEQKNSVVNRLEIEQAIRGLLGAFSKYRIPIIVHHSNTGHARVFKTIINRRFLVEVLGVGGAIGIYKEFEKLFERDGFFWQQYGLCQSNAGEYERAVQTLQHAYAIHEHFLIKHSLGAAALTAVTKVASVDLEAFEPSDLRKMGRDVLRELHEEYGYKDDLPIATLAELDMEVSKKYDSPEDLKRLAESYHRTLAFYLRDHPEMGEARRVYEKISDYLLRSQPMREVDYERLMDVAED